MCIVLFLGRCHEQTGDPDYLTDSIDLSMSKQATMTVLGPWPGLRVAISRPLLVTNCFVYSHYNRETNTNPSLLCETVFAMK